MKRTQLQFITDILDAMTNAESFISEMSLEDLENDVRTQWALERAFGIIGEAANNNASRISFHTLFSSTIIQVQRFSYVYT